MASRARRFLKSSAICLGVTGVCVAAIAFGWRAIDDGPQAGQISIHGWIALSIGVLATVVLSWVLMGLMFRSDRDGWDARAAVPPKDDAAL